MEGPEGGTFLMLPMIGDFLVDHGNGAVLVLIGLGKEGPRGGLDESVTV